MYFIPWEPIVLDLWTEPLLYENNPIFSKGAFCSYSFVAGVFLGHPLKERTEGAYEEIQDVGGVIG